MALVYTLKDSASNTAAADTLTSNFFTPSNSSLLVVIASGLLPGGRASAPTIGDSASLTWTSRLDTHQTGGGNSAMVAIWTAPVTTGTSMTVTVDYNATTLDVIGGHTLIVAEFTGHHTSSPVAQTFSGGGTTASTGAYSGTLSSTPNAGSTVLTGCNGEGASTATLAPGAGWTQIHEDNAGNSGTFFQYRSGTVSTNVSMGDLTTTGVWAIGGIEIKQSALTVASLAFDSTDTDNAIKTSGNSYTMVHSAASAAGQQRLVVLAAIAGSDGDFSAVTIDGQTATRVGSVARAAPTPDGYNPILTAYRATGTASTSINIVATYSGTAKSAFCCYSACYYLANAGSVHATTNNTVNDPTLNTNTANNGTVVAALYGYSGGGISVAWTGVTENFDSVGIPGYDDCFSGASADTTTGATPRTISADVTPDQTDVNWDRVASTTIAFALAAGATAYTTNVNPGTYTLNGSAVGVNQGGFFVLGAGTYALTGSAQSMRRIRTIEVVAGSYAMTGSNVTLSLLVPGDPIVFAFDSTDTDVTHRSDDDPYYMDMTAADATGVERVVLLAGIFDGAPTGDFDGVTIDGQVATRIGTLQRGVTDSGFNAVITAYRAAGTANIGFYVVAVPNCPGSQCWACYCALYRMEGALAGTLDSAGSTSFDPTLDLDTGAGGVALAGALGYNEASPSITWSGLTASFAPLAAYSEDRFFAAHALTSSAETPRAVSVATNFASGDSMASIALSFRSTSSGSSSGSGMLNFDAGSYAFTGLPQTLFLSGHVQVEAGSYAMTGSEITFDSATSVQVGPSSYAMTGSPVSFRRGLKVIPVAGAYTMSPTTVSTGTGLIFTAGSYAMTTPPVGLIHVAGELGIAVYVNATGVQAMAHTSDVGVTISGGWAETLSGNQMLASLGDVSIITTGGVSVDLTGTDLQATTAVGNATVSLPKTVEATGNTMTANVGNETVIAYASVTVNLTGVSMRAYVEPLDWAGSGYAPSKVARKRIQGEMVEMARWMGH